MTVKELRELLASYPDDYVVIMSKDAEGNAYSPLPPAEDAACDGHYEPTTTWYGEFTHHPEDRPAPFNAVCLWPTN